jgi:hypothetical protein
MLGSATARSNTGVGYKPYSDLIRVLYVF